MLSGCARLPVEQIDNPYVNLADTPFFPQQKYQCGPAALATVLAASGVGITADELVPRVYLPGRKGSLQAEMLAAAREYGRIPYRIDPELASLIAELEAGRPVLVFQNLSVSLFPVWHYAVVTGYDPVANEILLRSGVNAETRLGLKRFMRTWQRGERWAMVVLKPGELPANLDMDRYLTAVVGMERGNSPQELIGIYLSLTQQFPHQVIGWIGLANSYQRAGEYRNAIRAYQQALMLDPDNITVLNNLALAFSKEFCHVLALAQAELAVRLARQQNRFIAQSEDTLIQVESNASRKAVNDDSCEYILE